MGGEKCAAKIACRVTPAEIAEVDESNEFTFADNQVAAVNIAVQPPGLTAKAGSS